MKAKTTPSVMRSARHSEEAERLRKRGKNRAEILELGDVLGLILEKKEEILAEDIERMIEERQAARKAKDFAKADEIRNKLLEMGIVLLDTREGVKWKKA